MAQSEGTALTFVNTTAQPGLPPSEARRVRGHVTKLNFARRRERMGIADEGRASSCRPRATRRESGHDDPLSDRQIEPIVPQMLFVEQESLARFLLSIFRPIMFPGKTGTVASASESLWKEVNLAEPALLHVSLAAACREEKLGRYTGGASKAIWHETLAMRLISEKLATENVRVDNGILGAIFTLACVEGMVGSKAVSESHVRGLVQVIKTRHTKGICNTPDWFKEALVYHDLSDTVSARPPKYRAIVEAMTKEDSYGILAITSMVQDVLTLQRNLALMELYDMPEDFIINEIDAPLSRISHAAFAKGGQSPQIKSLAYALAIFSHLSSPRSALTESGLGTLALAMRIAMDQPSIRLCAYLQWTLWQCLLGYMVANDADSKNWFMMTLRSMCTVMEVHTIEALDVLLGTTLRPSPSLSGIFRDAWHELQLT